MGRINGSQIGAALLALAVTLGFNFLGGTLALGAHPFWAMNVGYVGIGIGLVIWLVLKLTGMPQRWLLGLGFAALVAAALCIWFGKAQFAASYAEDALAGRFWYYGWIAAMGAALAVIASLVDTILNARR